MSASKHETVMNWSGELSPQERAVALSSSSSPAAKWYADLCERIEQERYEESQRALWQSSFAPWRGPPHPNLRDNPLTPDLDAHELELARGTTIEELNDAIDRAAGAFGISAQHTRDVMDAIASITQIPARFLFGDPPTSLSHTVASDAWSTAYQGVPTEPPMNPLTRSLRTVLDRAVYEGHLVRTDGTPPSTSWVRGVAEYLNWQARVESDAVRAVMHSRVAGRSHDLPIIDDVEIEGKW